MIVNMCTMLWTHFKSLGMFMLFFHIIKPCAFVEFGMRKSTLAYQSWMPWWRKRKGKRKRKKEKEKERLAQMSSLHCDPSDFLTILCLFWFAKQHQQNQGQFWTMSAGDYISQFWSHSIITHGTVLEKKKFPKLCLSICTTSLVYDTQLVRTEN